MAMAMSAADRLSDLEVGHKLFQLAMTGNNKQFLGSQADHHNFL